MENTLIARKTLLRVSLLIGFLMGVNAGYAQFAQKIISESWTATGGQGLAYKNATTTDASKNVYVAGATMSGVNNSDIIVQKLTMKGVLVWEKTFAGTAGMNDAASAIFVDNSGNVYVTGTVVNSVADDQDLIVLKYNSSGVLQWNYTYHGSNIYKQDAGTAIVCDATGTRLYVAGTSGGNTTMNDYKTFSLNPSTGAVVWSQSYDYNSLVDIPKRILVKAAQVVIIGASQSSASPHHWEMASVNYDPFTGAFISATRSTSSTVAGINEINDVTVDPDGNTYLVGSINNPSTGFDVAVYKLDPSLNLLAERYYDIHGLDDKGMDIEYASGNLYVTGYSSKNGFGKETLLMKLDATGTVLWQKELSGSAGGDDQGEQVLRDGNRIFVAATVDDGNNKDFKLYCFDPSGNLLTSASYNGASNLNDVPQTLEIDLDGNIIITGSEQLTATTFISKTVKYAMFDRNYDYALDGTKPTHLKGTVVIGFNPGKLKLAAMNSRKFQGGELTEFVDNSTLTALQVKTGVDWTKYKTYKVFRRMTPADSLSVTRLGDTIKAIDFWTYLSVDVPKEWDIKSLCDSLDLLTDHIRKTAPDIIFELYDTPHDYLFSTDQLGLYDNPTYPDADINAKDAWDLQVGQSNVKVAIMDAPMSWAHEEFNNGAQNEPGPGKKIGGGWNYYNNMDIVNDPDFSYHHGTAVAGIVGARRNNYAPGNDDNATGIAGIAGGDMSNGNFGVQLFSLGISVSQSPLANMSIIANALHESYSNSPSNPHDIGVNLINASWGTVNNPGSPFLDAVEECWKNHCILVAARGQYNDGEANHVVWPACLNDLHVINVMASGTDGKRKIGGSTANGAGNWNSNYGILSANNTFGCPADIMAPGIFELVSTTASANGYTAFSGTSASAPHVTGVAALMYSQHQESNGYPNKLGTEDVERIIEKTATDFAPSGYDLATGYGLLNGYEAVKQVSNPYYVKHLTGNPVATIATVTVTLPYSPNDGYPDGEFPHSKRHMMTWDIDVTLPLGHEIIDWWEMEAANVKGGNYKNSLVPVTVFQAGAEGSFETNILFDPIGGNHVHKTAKMAVYRINVGDDGNESNDFWYPMSPEKLKYQFSVHVKKSADAGIEEMANNSNFLLYPNPSNQHVTIKSKSGIQVSGYEVIDATGRIVAKENKVNGNEFTVNVVPLTQGMYYCRIFSDNSVETIPFIKSKE